MAQRRRGFETAGDMVRSMGLVLLGVAALLLLTLRDEPDDPVTVVDASVVESTTSQARAAAPFALEAPLGLDDGWRVTSIRYQPGTDAGSVWHIGYITPADDYAAVEQTDGEVMDALEGQLPEPEEDGAAQVGGRTWTRYVDQTSDRRALVVDGAASELAVAGTADWAGLEELAGALAPSAG
ncbi:MAG: DUF4245 domain-containing protein [Candidatus Nanopelagicales bacterium]